MPKNCGWFADPLDIDSGSRYISRVRAVADAELHQRQNGLRQMLRSFALESPQLRLRDAATSTWDCSVLGTMTPTHHKVDVSAVYKCLALRNTIWSQQKYPLGIKTDSSSRQERSSDLYPHSGIQGRYVPRLTTWMTQRVATRVDLTLLPRSF